MKLWESLIRPLLFRLDPETAHNVARAIAARGGRSGWIHSMLRKRYADQIAPNPVDLWGLRFPNPIGLAAGFDKNAEMLPFLEALGFGFIEAGTVTLRPQPGNPKPRIFRYPAREALINRLGFNNDGADVVAERLRRFIERGAETPILINIGRNKDVPNEQAAEAYAQTYDKVAPFAHGVVVNISSPNTPGLRELQGGGFLRGLMERLLEARARAEFATHGSHPILVKVSPDMALAELEQSVEVCMELADGMVATNTTLDHAAVVDSGDQAGGLSGAPLTQRSLEVLRVIRSIAGELPLVGVGGIMDAGHARARMDAGANLVEVYTGFIYGGPSLPRALAEEVLATESRE